MRDRRRRTRDGGRRPPASRRRHRRSTGAAAVAGQPRPSVPPRSMVATRVTLPGRARSHRARLACWGAWACWVWFACGYDTFARSTTSCCGGRWRERASWRPLTPSANFPNPAARVAPCPVRPRDERHYGLRSFVPSAVVPACRCGRALATAGALLLRRCADDDQDRWYFGGRPVRARGVGDDGGRCRGDRRRPSGCDFGARPDAQCWVREGWCARRAVRARPTT